MCTTNRPVASRTLLGPLITLTFWIGALDLDANAGGVGEDVELLNKPFRKADLAMKVRAVLDKPTS